MINHSLSIQILLQSLDAIGNSSEKNTINSLSSKMRQPPIALRTMLNSFAKFQNEFILIIGNREWNSLHDEEFLDGSLDDEEITLSPSSNYIVIEKNIYDRLTKYVNQIEEYNNDIDYLFVSDNVYSHKRLKYNDLLSRVNNKLIHERKIACKNIYGKEIYPFGIYYYPECSEFYAIACKPNNEDIISFYNFNELEAFSYERTDALSGREKRLVQTINKYLWSPEEINRNDSPSTQRILVMNESNTKKKVMHDISRFEYKKEEREDGTLLLEFQLIETPSYYSWLLGYGSSIVVLAPTVTREKILNEYKKILA